MMLWLLPEARGEELGSDAPENEWEDRDAKRVIKKKVAAVFRPEHTARRFL